MANIQNPNGFEANETIDGVNDIMHIFQPGSAGTRRNKRIILNTLKAFFQIITGGTLNNIVTIGSSEELQDSGVAVGDIAANTAALANFLKGMNHVVLTNYTTTGLPAIAANSQVEINGALYTNPSEVAITGTTANDTWYDILLTPSGSTFTASFIARGTGVWSDSKQGLYSGNNRVVAIVRRTTTSSLWINKNVLVVRNRTVKIKVEIGNWDMDTDGQALISIGVSQDKCRGVKVVIRNDGNTQVGDFHDNNQSETTSVLIQFSGTDMILFRGQNGVYDNATHSNDVDYNRGWIIPDYEV